MTTPPCEVPAILIPPRIPDKEYSGRASGNRVEFYVIAGKTTMHALTMNDFSVKGLNVPVTVVVKDGQFTVRFDIKEVEVSQ